MERKFDFESMPVVEVVNEILIDATRKGASDVHFDPRPDNMIVRIRIDSSLINYCEIPISIQKNLITRVKIMSSMNITETRLPQDGAVKTALDGVALDLRVSSIPTSNGEKIVVRILDYSLSDSGIESLGFSDDNYRKVIKMISVPSGIILVTGATGTGKSTTVYAILQKLNKEATNLITVEDPIEMDIEGINQIQTNSEIGLDFATALRSILRQDPNIIMVGEIRDTETARIAVRASITGHLVLSTLHTNDSLNTIERLLDMDVERYLLASSLTGIISQKLAKKLCPHCKKTKPVNDYEKQIFQKVLNEEVNEIYVNEGCEECDNGYKGRMAIQEVLIINQSIRDAISSGVKKEVIRDLVFKADVVTLLQDGLYKAKTGLTTLEEVLKLIEFSEIEDEERDFNLKSAMKHADIAKEVQVTLKKEEEFMGENLSSPEKMSSEETKTVSEKPPAPKKDETLDMEIKEEKKESPEKAEEKETRTATSPKTEEPAQKSEKVNAILEKAKQQKTENVETTETKTDEQAKQDKISSVLEKAQKFNKEQE